MNNVYKNSQQDTNILVGKEIQITENAYYDKQTNTTYNINGYTNMVKEKEYLLFLIPVDDGKYATRAVTFERYLYIQRRQPSINPLHFRKIMFKMMVLLKAFSKTYEKNIKINTKNFPS